MKATGDAASGTDEDAESSSGARGISRAAYNLILLLVAGLGGLLYGVDLGIIGSALPYLEATSGLQPGQLSFIVASVLLGTVISTLFAGMLADWLGRKKLMVLAGVFFVISIPIIAMARGYGPLILGRLLQGVSSGVIGVVVPLYLAECLSAAKRGKGTGIFQWLLTFGIMAAALIGMYFSMRVEAVAKSGDAAQLFAFKDAAWRGIFWVSLPPGILFVLGSFFVAESPRWLFRQGRAEGALAALRRSRTEEQAQIELREMKELAAAEKARLTGGLAQSRESLCRRKYVVPFVLACLVLACTQATGAASIISYNVTILIQAGLDDLQAHRAYVILTAVKFVSTIGGVLLVDRRGRKFLLSLGTAGIIVSLVWVALLFRQTEQRRMDCSRAVQSMVTSGKQLKLAFTPETAARLLAGNSTGAPSPLKTPATLIVIYSYGGFRTATKAVRSDDPTGLPLQITAEDCLPANKVVAFFSNPFADLQKARVAPLIIDSASITPVPSARNGWLTALGFYVFMAFYSIGPGVCVWLALSELMPTRIRSNGMSIALVLNQAVSATIAAVFLPTVGKHGYSAMFYVLAACTGIYFIVAAFLLPETKGKTLEEIEQYFERKERQEPFRSL
jgi:MFS family permease